MVTYRGGGRRSRSYLLECDEVAGAELVPSAELRVVLDLLVHELVAAGPAGDRKSSVDSAVSEPAVDGVLAAALEALLRVQQLDATVFDAALLLGPGAPLDRGQLARHLELDGAYLLAAPSRLARALADLPERAARASLADLGEPEEDAAEALPPLLADSVSPLRARGPFAQESKARAFSLWTAILLDRSAVLRPFERSLACSGGDCLLPFCLSSREGAGSASRAVRSRTRWRRRWTRPPRRGCGLSWTGAASASRWTRCGRCEVPASGGRTFGAVCVVVTRSAIRSRSSRPGGGPRCSSSGRGSAYAPLRSCSRRCTLRASRTASVWCQTPTRAAT